MALPPSLTHNRAASYLNHNSSLCKGQHGSVNIGHVGGEQASLHTSPLITFDNTSYYKPHTQKPQLVPGTMAAGTLSCHKS
jgi:hypothetical protein